jgi:hypothetical protein
MEKFSKAWDNLKSCPVDIRDLPRSRNGKRCNCTCIDCKQPLEACQGFIKAWYFRHQSKTECTGGPMTAIHLLAQFLLTGNHAIQTSKGEETYTEGTMEYVIPGSRYRADVAGTKLDGNRFVIEIFVKHKLLDDGDKAKFLREQKIHSIEIDISNVEANIRNEDLLQILLTDIYRQRVIYSPISAKSIIDVTPVIHENQSAISKPSWLEELMPFAMVAAFIYGGYQLISNYFPKVRKKRKR